MEENFVKVTNIVYRILDFLPDNDPLKNRAKEKALAILENLTLQKDGVLATVLDDIRVLENYLEIGKYQGWISSVNFLIITKNYGDIKRNINLPKELIKQSLPPKGRNQIPGVGSTSV